MSEAKDLESLVRAVTDLVLARLDDHPDPTDRSRPADRRLPPAGEAARGDVSFLLPVAPTRPADLARRLAELERLGWRVRGAAAPDALAAMELAGISRTLTLAPLDPNRRDSGGPLGPPGRREVVVVGSLGLAFAHRLAALDDDDPFVRVVARALLDGRKVLALADDLTPSPAAAPAAAAAQAAAALQALERLGLEVRRGAELEDALSRLADARATVSRAAGGLLTEADVVRLRDAGETRLALPPRTIVTPLARSKAAELGLALEEGG
ncbi:MAG: hypothetical protein HY907_12730 [Deltaproteobacteria bacterium]|nr:hypothetical protein [Deltaproteobacteria bacterium]